MRKIEGKQEIWFLIFFGKVCNGLRMAQALSPYFDYPQQPIITRLYYLLNRTLSIYLYLLRGGLPKELITHLFQCLFTVAIPKLRASATLDWDRPFAFSN